MAMTPLAMRGPRNLLRQIREAMEVTAQDLGAPGYDTSFGWGLVQAKAALEELQGQ